MSPHPCLHPPARRPGVAFAPASWRRRAVGCLALVLATSPGLAGASTGTLAGSTTVAYSGSIVTFTVAQAGLYRITAVGAQGSGASNDLNRGGGGATVSGNFVLSANMMLDVLVGGKGEARPEYFGAGGGGGSFVVLKDGTTPWVVAGGGGGASGAYGNAQGLGASAGTQGVRGKNGPGVSGGAGGTGGAGGGSGPDLAAASGGGGLRGDGADSVFGVPGGTSFVGGGANCAEDGCGRGGGFGGGGNFGIRGEGCGRKCSPALGEVDPLAGNGYSFTANGGGGGGGYSGGGSGFGGGGGGSFLAAIATDRLLTAGLDGVAAFKNAAHGSVRFELLVAAPPIPEPGTPLLMLAGLLAIALRRRRP